MTYQEIDAILEQSAQEQRILDQRASKFAGFLVGRLRHVSSLSALAKLKAELTKFDSRTGNWRV